MRVGKESGRKKCHGDTYIKKKLYLVQVEEHLESRRA